MQGAAALTVPCAAQDCNKQPAPHINQSPKRLWVGPQQTNNHPKVFSRSVGHSPAPQLHCPTGTLNSLSAAHTTYIAQQVVPKDLGSRPHAAGVVMAPAKVPCQVLNVGQAAVQGYLTQ